MSLRSNIDRIMQAIVDLVERTNGPVPFSDLDEKVPGFHQADGPAYALFAGREELVVWDEMSAAGLKALDRVVLERRVALQMVKPVFPLMLGARLAESASPPYVLLPVRAANIETPNCAMRVSPGMQRKMLLEATRTGLQGYRALAPHAVRCTADQFSF